MGASWLPYWSSGNKKWTSSRAAHRMEGLRQPPPHQLPSRAQGLLQPWGPKPLASTGATQFHMRGLRPYSHWGRNRGRSSWRRNRGPRFRGSLRLPKGGRPGCQNPGLCCSPQIYPAWSKLLRLEQESRLSWGLGSEQAEAKPPLEQAAAERV